MVSASFGGDAKSIRSSLIHHYVVPLPLLGEGYASRKTWWLAKIQDTALRAPRAVDFSIDEERSVRGRARIYIRNRLRVTNVSDVYRKIYVQGSTPFGRSV